MAALKWRSHGRRVPPDPKVKKLTCLALARWYEGDCHTHAATKKSLVLVAPDPKLPVAPAQKFRRRLSATTGFVFVFERAEMAVWAAAQLLAGLNR